MNTMTETRKMGRPLLSPEYGPKVRRSVILFESQVATLKELSNATGIPISELVRRAIESMLTPREVRA